METVCVIELTRTSGPNEDTTDCLTGLIRSVLSAQRVIIISEYEQVPKLEECDTHRVEA